MYWTSTALSTRLFCDNRHSRRGQFRALVTTNASNVGINKHSISLQARFEWCRDLQTYFQERGRGSRSEGVQSTCILYADLASYIYLMTQLITTSQDDEVNDHGSSDVEGYNSAISPSRNERPQNRKEQNKYALGTMARRSLPVKWAHLVLIHVPSARGDGTKCFFRYIGQVWCCSLNT